MAIRNQTVNTVGYGLSNALQSLAPSPVIANRAPTASDTSPYGTIWIFQPSNLVYCLTSITNAQANWQLLEASGGAGVFTSLTVNPGPTSLTGAVTVTAGNNPVHISTTDNVASAISLTTNGGTTETLVLTNTQGTAAGAITLNAAAGGVLVEGAGKIALNTTDNAAGAIALLTNGGTTETITVTNTQGTAAGAITLNAIAGGVLVEGAGVVELSTTDNAAGAITISANGGTSETILIEAQQGTGATSINVVSTSGGITLNGGTAIALTGGASAGMVSVAPNTNSVASPTASSTQNERVLRTIFTGFTTAQNASQAFTITSSQIVSTSGILVNVTNLNASTNGALMQIQGITQATGSIVISTKNIGAGALGAGDNVIITCWIIS